MPVLKCLDTKNMQFNLAAHKCEFICRSEGYFADVVAPNKYYFCYRPSTSATNYLYLHESCPDNYLFRDRMCQEKTALDKVLEVVLNLEKKLTIPRIP